MLRYQKKTENEIKGGAEHMASQLSNGITLL
jgi:hypothetical protein